MSRQTRLLSSPALRGAAVAEWLARDSVIVVINYLGNAGSDARTTAGDAAL
jgi:hypothetical protein